MNCNGHDVFTVKLSEEESLSVERAFYEKDSYRNLVALLCKELGSKDCPDAKEMLEKYNQCYLEAQMKCEMVQDMVMENHVEPSFDPLHYRFNFQECEVYCWYEK